MGFSSKAISKAKRLGIILYALNDHSEFKEFDLKIPFLIEEISPKTMDILYKLSREQIGQHSNIYFNKKGLCVNEISVNDVINQSWKDGTLKFDLVGGEQECDIPHIDPPYNLNFFTYPTLDIVNKMEIKHLKLKMVIQFKYYLCDIRDIMYDKILKNISKEKLTLFIDTTSLPETLKNLVPVSRSYAQEFTGIQYVIKIKNNADVEFNSMSLAYLPEK